MDWPDFFTVSPHGAGLQSFLFYLSGIGLPCSPWTAIDTAENAWEAMKFVNARKRRYKHVGVTVDRALTNRDLFPGLNGKKVPVFQLVRDPVAVLASNVNLGVGAAVVRAVMENPSPDEKKEPPLDSAALRPDLKTWFTTFFFDMPGFIFRYGSQLRSVARYTDESLIEVFDTGELTEAGAAQVLGRIRRHFGGYYGEGVRKLFSVSYNSFPNRVRHSVPLCELWPEARDPVSIWLCPKDMYAFHSQYKKSTVVGGLQVDGADFILFTPATGNPPGVLWRELSAAYGSVAERVRAFRKRTAEACELYERAAVRPEDMVAFLLENKECLERFRVLLDGELDMVERLRPGLTASWRHTVRCL